MSRGHGRAERWLLDWLAQQQELALWYCWGIGRLYQPDDAPSGIASIRRAARSLAREGLAEVEYSVPDAQRGRRSMSVGLPGAKAAIQERHRQHMQSPEVQQAIARLQANH